jgi:hypothetical protein
MIQSEGLVTVRHRSGTASIKRAAQMAALAIVVESAWRSGRLMSTQDSAGGTQPPSTGQLLLTAAIAVAVASLLLITIVLPAEYGIDPLGTGSALGLTAMAAPPAATTPPSGPLAGGEALAPVQNGPAGHYGAEYKTNAIQLVLGPYQYVEYKYRLEKDATMLYTWTATSTPIVDFHGEPEGTAGPVVSFDTEPKLRDSGSFTAPFSGIHGWYWENTGGDSLTITLTTAGFYTAAIEFKSNRTHEYHELTSLVHTSRLPDDREGQ